MKTFPTLAVVSVSTGVSLVKDFTEIHGVFDYFYPGIMDLGLAAMQPHASAHLEKHFPDLVEGADAIQKVGFEEYSKQALKKFGPTMEVPAMGGVSASETGRFCLKAFNKLYK